MYYEENPIETPHGTVLAHRSTPTGEWQVFTIQEMCKKYEALRFASFNLKNDVEDYLEDHNFVDDPRALLEHDAQEVDKVLLQERNLR